MNKRLTGLYGGPNARLSMLPTQPDPTPGGPAPTPTPAPPAPAPAPPAPSGSVTMTQAELDAKFAERAARAEREAVRKIAEDLGMSPADAKKYIDDSKAAADAAKTEEQRRAETLAAKEAEITAREAAAAASSRDAERRGLLAEFGATGQDLVDAASLLGTRVKDDATPDELRTAVDTLKGQRPELFKTAGGTPTPTPGRPPTPAPTPSPHPGTFGEQGLDELRRRGHIKEPAAT